MIKEVDVYIFIVNTMESQELSKIFSGYLLKAKDVPDSVLSAR